MREIYDITSYCLEPDDKWTKEQIFDFLDDNFFEVYVLRSILDKRKVISRLSCHLSCFYTRSVLTQDSRFISNADLNKPLDRRDAKTSPTLFSLAIEKARSPKRLLVLKANDVP